MKRLLLLILLAPATFAETWVSESEGSLSFEASFEGEPLPGEFPAFTVRYSSEALVVRVPLAASDMGDDEMNAILHDPMWLAVEEFASARFRAERIDCEASSCTAYGELALKGASAPVEVPFTWKESGNSARLQGEVTLDRTTFDVGSGEWSTGESIGLDVVVRFDIQLSK